MHILFVLVDNSLHDQAFTALTGSAATILYRNIWKELQTVIGWKHCCVQVPAALFFQADKLLQWSFQYWLCYLLYAGPMSTRDSRQKKICKSHWRQGKIVRDAHAFDNAGLFSSCV